MYLFTASPVAQLVKHLLAMREAWVGKILGEGNGYPLQYSGLENSKAMGLDLTEGLALSLLWLRW